MSLRQGDKSWCLEIGTQSLLFTAPRTAQLFERLRRDRPEITDPQQRFPTFPFRAPHPAGVVGTRCARPWNPSSQRGLLSSSLSPFPKTPSLTTCHHTLHLSFRVRSSICEDTVQSTWPTTSSPDIAIGSSDGTMPVCFPRAT